MQKRILIYGSYKSKSCPFSQNDFDCFVKALCKKLLDDEKVIIVNGGNGEDGSADLLLFDVYKKGNGIYEERFETWLPNDNVKTKLRIGKTQEIAGSRQMRRFILQQKCDAVIALCGGTYTQSIIELALALEKPVLPLAFTGGKSKEKWDEYKDEIIKNFEKVISETELKWLMDTGMGANNESKITATADCIIKAIAKKCLVLMPFDKGYLSFYENCIEKAIDENNFKPVRIDKYKSTGNIPDIFRREIDSCKKIIIDITDLKPNVMYELGYVHCKKIEPLIITRSAEVMDTDNTDFPFYLKQEMITVATKDEKGNDKIKQSIKKYLVDEN